MAASITTKTMRTPLLLLLVVLATAPHVTRAAHHQEEECAATVREREGHCQAGRPLPSLSIQSDSHLII